MFIAALEVCCCTSFNQHSELSQRADADSLLLNDFGEAFSKLVRVK